MGDVDGRDPGRWLGADGVPAEWVDSAAPDVEFAGAAPWGEWSLGTPAAFAVWSAAVEGSVAGSAAGAC